MELGPKHPQPGGHEEAFAIFQHGYRDLKFQNLVRWPKYSLRAPKRHFISTRPRCYKTFFVLNSTEHKISLHGEK